MSTVAQSLSTSLFGATRRAVLGLLLLRPDESFYLRQVARLTRAGQGAVQRELARLAAAGLLTRTRQGNQIFYQANRRCPILKELSGIMSKTAGLADILRDALAPLAPRISVAFIYGSFASAQQRAASDVDVMVIGEAHFAELCRQLRAAEERLGREVNPTVYPVGEFRSKLAAGHHFLASVLRGEKIFLVGDERELARLGKERLAG